MAAAAAELSRDTKTMQTRILIADDQPDVLLALRLLLKGNGYATETVSSPAELLEAVASSRIRSCVDGSELRARHDVGAGRARSALASQRDRKCSADYCDDRMGDGRTRGGGDAARRYGFCREAVDEFEVARQPGKTGGDRSRAAGAGQECRAGRARHTTRWLLVFTSTSAKLPKRARFRKDFCRRKFRSSPDTKSPARGSRRALLAAIISMCCRSIMARLGFCIADVAGKGMPAALLMSNLAGGGARAGFGGHFAGRSLHAAEFFVCRNMANDRFITFFYGQLDGPTGTLRYANAGHNPPVVMHRDGSHERLDGGRDRARRVSESKLFTNGSAQLQSGDRLVLYTDGVTEAANCRRRGIRRRAADSKFSASTVLHRRNIFRRRSLRAPAHSARTAGTTTRRC